MSAEIEFFVDDETVDVTVTITDLKDKNGLDITAKELARHFGSKMGEWVLTNE